MTYAISSEMNRPYLALWFSDLIEPELLRTRFWSYSIDEPAECVRGRTGGAYGPIGTFQWTGAVQALSVLMLRIAASHLSPTVEPIIAGENSTLASCLDYSVAKGT